MERQNDADMFHVRPPMNAAAEAIRVITRASVYPVHLPVQKAVSDDMNVENSMSVLAISGLVG